jgi:hypothetical protein
MMDASDDAVMRRLLRDMLKGILIRLLLLDIGIESLEIERLRWAGDSLLEISDIMEEQREVEERLIDALKDVYGLIDE